MLLPSRLPPGVAPGRRMAEQIDIERTVRQLAGGDYHRFRLGNG
jgi:hypothetical protein